MAENFTAEFHMVVDYYPCIHNFISTPNVIQLFLLCATTEWIFSYIASSKLDIIGQNFAARCRYKRVIIV